MNTTTCLQQRIIPLSICTPNSTIIMLQAQVRFHLFLLSYFSLLFSLLFSSLLFSSLLFSSLLSSLLPSVLFYFILNIFGFFKLIHELQIWRRKSGPTTFVVIRGNSCQVWRGMDFRIRAIRSRGFTTTRSMDMASCLVINVCIFAPVLTSPPLVHSPVLLPSLLFTPRFLFRAT